MPDAPFGTGNLSAISYNSSAQRSATPAAGQWQGENTRLFLSDKSFFASLFASLEEASFLRAQFRSTELAKRKIGENSQLRNEPLEKALAYIEKASEIDKDKHLKPFLMQVLEQQNVSSSQLKRLAAEHFTDISQQYIALAYVHKQLRRRRKSNANNASSKLPPNVDDALNELVQEHGAAIQAGMNVSEAANTVLNTGTGKQLGSLNSLRQFYRDAVLDYGGLTGTFNRIVTEYGEDKFSDSLAYLVLALGADLASEGSSLPKERLTMIIDDLYKLQSLGSLDDECTDFINQLDRIFSPRVLPKKLRLMEELLSILEKKWLVMEKLNRTARALNISTQMEVYFWRGFKDLVHLLPQKCYSDPFERDKLLTLIQECLDQAIDNEHL